MIYETANMQLASYCVCTCDKHPFPWEAKQAGGKETAGSLLPHHPQASHTCAQQRSALETLAGSTPVDRLEKWDVWAPAILTLDMGWKAEQQGRKAVL